MQIVCFEINNVFYGNCCTECHFILRPFSRVRMQPGDVMIGTQVAK